LTNRRANTDAPVMPNGRRGDNPISDITIHGEEIYGPEIDDLIREIREIGGPVAPPQGDVFAQDGRELYELAFRAEGNESLRPEFRERLLALRDRLADREFWDWAFADDVTEELRRLVMSCWDPIGVADFPEAADEYDGYLPRIFAVLWSGDEALLQERLSASRTEMGLPPDPSADANTARRIFDWYRERLPRA
jgi:hypothetical protein